MKTILVSRLSSIERAVTFFLGIYLIAASPHVLADTKNSTPQLEITSVEVIQSDSSSTQLMINGVGIDNGAIPWVTLGGSYLYVCGTCYSDSYILAEADNNVPAGDYRIVVKTGSAEKDYDSYDFTLGAVGPQGEPGIDGAPGLTGADGEQGLTGAHGAQGLTGADGAQGLTGADGEQGLTGADGEQGLPGEQGSPGTGQTINLTIDPVQFPGIVAQNFNALFPDVELNSVKVEIPSVCNGGQVVIINGPAIETQVVEGFDGAGNPFNDSGLSQELPLVFEVITPTPDDGSIPNCSSTLQAYFDGYVPGSEPAPIELIITRTAGDEAFRWNLFRFQPESSTPGLVGQRFTFSQLDGPDNLMRIVRIGGIESRSNISFNPVTDKRVEISGVNELYPAVIEATDRRLTLVYDYSESTGIWSWASEIATSGTTGAGKRSISVVTVIPDGPSVQEISRVNYFECFPVKFEQFAGFVQDLQIKERLIIDCSLSTPGVY